MSNANIKSDPKSVKLEDIGASLLNPATEDTLQKLVGFEIEPYTKIEATYPTSLTEVYTYKNGADVVATITVTFQDTAKNILLSVEKDAI